MLQGRVGYYLRRAWRSIWFRPAVYALLAVAVLGLTPLINPLIPGEWVYEVDVAVVDRVLSILTSSMLAVAIFSLSTMVMQLNAAAQTATPRSRPLLAEDRTAQNAISTFIGTFLFAVLGVIGIQLQFYDQTGLFVLFVLSLLLIALVVLNLILWIRRLSSLGGVGEAMERLEDAADAAFRDLANDPWLGGREARSPPEGGHPVHSQATGFVQTIDAERLGAVADRTDGRLHVLTRAGDSADPTRPLAILDHPPSDEDVEEIRRAFVIGHDRDFRSDPRYGVLVLSEIASRALSPAVNDSGTAIDGIGTLVRVLIEWRRAVAEAEPECRHPNLLVPPLEPDTVLVEGFRGIARDGAGRVEVGVRVQQALGSLARFDPDAFAGPAHALARDHLDRARRAIEAGPDLRALEAAHADAMRPKARAGEEATGNEG